MPRLVYEHRVSREREDICVQLLEVWVEVCHLLELRRADERKVCRVEDHNEPLPPEVRELHGARIVLVKRLELVVWDSLANPYARAVLAVGVVEIPAVFTIITLLFLCHSPGFVRSTYDTIRVLSVTMTDPLPIICVAGPTASGKSARAIELAQELNGEVISVDSRQVYRMLDIGTEKISEREMQGIPHHLIDIRDPRETYSAGDFARDAASLIEDLRAQGKRPILAGGTHFYFDALLYGLPEGAPKNEEMRTFLEARSEADLMEEIKQRDPRRAERIDPMNKRRLVRALEIINEHGQVPERNRSVPRYEVEWVILNPERDELRERITKRLEEAFARGLVEEVRTVRAYVGDERLNELGLEYRVIGEYLRDERNEDSLLPVLSSKLWHFARHQKAWLRKLTA